MIDTKFTRITKNGNEWLDGGHVKVGFDKVLRTQPELITDDELASVVAEVSGKGMGVLAITGVSSSGLLTLSEERAQEVNGFEVFDFRLMHGERDLDKYIQRDQIVQGRDEHGEFLSFEVPANATIDVVNRWLIANYPSFCLDVDVTTNTSSGVGANVLTGLLGENRRPVEAHGLTMIVRGEVEQVRGKEQVDAYRGTQGYAGIVKKVIITARKRPVLPGMFLLPLRGTTLETAFAGSYAQVLSHLAPWIYGEEGGTHISSADIVDLTGLHTIHRVTHNGSMDGFSVSPLLGEQIDDEHHAVICMRTEGPTPVAFNDSLIEQLSALADGRAIGNLKLLEKSTDVSPLIALRGQVPERARQEAEESHGKEVYSTSMDMDAKILFDFKAIDFSEATVRFAYEAAYQSIIRAYQPLEDLREFDIHFTWNGHFYMTNTSDYYVGGHNPHPRLTGPAALKQRIVAAKKKVTANLIALHGKRFGTFTVVVQEGEKHYPHDAQAQAHFAASQPYWAAERSRLTSRAGITHNARVPSAYAEVMRRTGYPL